MTRPTVVEPIGDYLTTWGSEYSEWGGPHSPPYQFHGTGTIEAYPGHIDPDPAARTVPLRTAFTRIWSLFLAWGKGYKYDNPSYPTGTILVELKPDAAVPGLSDGLGAFAGIPWGRAWWGWETESFGGHWAARLPSHVRYDEQPETVLEGSLGDPVLHDRLVPQISMHGLWWRPFLSGRATSQRLSVGEILMGGMDSRIEIETSSTYSPPAMWGSVGAIFGTLGLSWGGHTVRTTKTGQAKYARSR